MTPAGPTNSTPAPSTNLRTSAAAMAAAVVFDAAWREFLKPKHRVRLIAAMREAIDRLERDGGVLRLRTVDPVAVAQAAADAAEVLRRLVADRED